MLQLIETICFENGAFQRIPLHEDRMNRTRYHLFDRLDPLSLDQFLSIPESLKDQKVKCRIIYSDKIEYVEYQIYIQKIIRSLRLVADNTISYAYKFKNRDSLNSLLSKRDNADEILIVKNGQVTDTSFTNIVFLKQGIWFTPESTLLPGTRRKDYLLKNLIFPRIIRPDELHQYEEARLINAMLSLEDAETIPITSIY